MKTYRPIQELQASGIVVAGISLRHGGVSRAPYTSLNLGEHVNDDPNAVETNRKILFRDAGLTNLRYCRQIHSASVVPINDEAQPLAEHIPEADALVTAQHNIALGIFTADCIPIFVLDVETPAIGIVHAGWRGTFARIAVNAITEMKTLFGTRPKNCHIHLGPSIQKCCYTVSTELLTQFTAEFGSTVANGTNLSLQTANINQLIEIGVLPDAISVSEFCTACRIDLFYSHRAENGQTGRMLSYIKLNAYSKTHNY